MFWVKVIKWGNNDLVLLCSLDCDSIICQINWFLYWTFLILGPFGVFASFDNGSADWLAWQVVGRFQQNHGNRSGSKLLRFVKSDRYNKETDLNIKFWWDFIFPAVECQWFMLGNRYRPKKWHPRSGINGYQAILIQLFAGGRLLGHCSACYKYSKQQIFSIDVFTILNAFSQSFVKTFLPVFTNPDLIEKKLSGYR